MFWAGVFDQEFAAEGCYLYSSQTAYLNTRDTGYDCSMFDCLCAGSGEGASSKPTKMPTFKPTDAPTTQPTARPSDDGLCVLTMYDSASDGWNGAGISMQTCNEVTVWSETLSSSEGGIGTRAVTCVHAGAAARRRA